MVAMIKEIPEAVIHVRRGDRKFDKLVALLTVEGEWREKSKEKGQVLEKKKSGDLSSC